MDPFENYKPLDFSDNREKNTTYDEDERAPIDKEVDIIYNKIRKNNGMIIRRLMMCQIPYFQVEKIIKRIIKLTLDYKR